MNATSYHVSPANYGGRTIDAVGVEYYEPAVQSLFNTLHMRDRQETPFTAGLILEPDNPYDENAISIRWNDQVLGYVPADVASEYRQLRRIAVSGVTPTCDAWLYSQTIHGEHRFRLRISLRDPSHLFMLNDPPYEDYVLLPEGRSCQVTKEDEHYDVLLNYVPPSGTGDLLVSLHTFEAGVRTLWIGVEVRVDGRKIGELTKTTSAKFVDAIEHYSSMGYDTYCRANIKGSSISAEVTLHAAKSNELSEEDLDPENLQPLPRLVDFLANPSEYPMPPATYQERQKPGPQPIQTNTTQVFAQPDFHTSAPPQQEATSEQPSSTPSESAEIPSRGMSEVKSFFFGALLVFGVFCLITPFVNFSIRSLLGFVLIGGANIYLGVHYFLAERADNKAREEHQQLSATYAFLTDADKELLGDPPEFKPINRHWGRTWLIAIITVIVGAAILPASTKSEQTQTPVSTTEKTSTTARLLSISESATEETESSPETSATEATEEVNTEDPQELAPALPFETAADSFPAQDNDLAPVPEPMETPVPAPAPADAYYANCSEARAAGAAPIFAGSPGYRSALDRDGDGVACE